MINFHGLRAVFLCALALSIADSHYADAQEIKVDLGVTQFTQAANGFWYQDGFAHTLRLTSPSASIKLYSDKMDGWQAGIGLIGLALIVGLKYVFDWAIV